MHECSWCGAKFDISEGWAEVYEHESYDCPGNPRCQVDPWDQAEREQYERDHAEPN